MKIGDHIVYKSAGAYHAGIIVSSTLINGNEVFLASKVSPERETFWSVVPGLVKLINGHPTEHLTERDLSAPEIIGYRKI